MTKIDPSETLGRAACRRTSAAVSYAVEKGSPTVNRLANWTLLPVFAVFVLSAESQAVSAAPPPRVQADEACRESLEIEAAHSIRATTQQFSDYTEVASNDHLTRYYFTKPNNKVYPWAVRAVFTVKPYEKGKDVESSITTCLPKAAAQPTPEQWQGAAGWAAKVMARAERELIKSGSGS